MSSAATVDMKVQSVDVFSGRNCVFMHEKCFSCGLVGLQIGYSTWCC